MNALLILPHCASTREPVSGAPLSLSVPRTHWVQHCLPVAFLEIQSIQSLSGILFLIAGHQLESRSAGQKRKRLEDRSGKVPGRTARRCPPATGILTLSVPCPLPRSCPVL